MRKGEMFTATDYIRNILTEIVARRGERGERRLVVHADNAKPHAAKVTRAFAMAIVCELHDIQHIRRTYWT
jgi:hypothetical protein